MGREKPSAGRSAGQLARRIRELEKQVAPEEERGGRRRAAGSLADTFAAWNAKAWVLFGLKRDLDPRRSGPDSAPRARYAARARNGTDPIRRSFERSKGPANALPIVL